MVDRQLFGMLLVIAQQLKKQWSPFGGMWVGFDCPLTCSLDLMPVLAVSSLLGIFSSCPWLVKVGTSCISLLKVQSGLPSNQHSNSRPSSRPWNRLHPGYHRSTTL